MSNPKSCPVETYVLHITPTVRGRLDRLLTLTHKRDIQALITEAMAVLDTLLTVCERDLSSPQILVASLVDGTLRLDSLDQQSHPH
ncbi:MAG: hypothetical protein QM756_43900 [Polyangiaceae bacterium]